MTRINLMSIVLLSGLVQQAVAMNHAGNQPGVNQLDEPVLNREQEATFKKNWDEKEQIERDAFWQEQFGKDSVAKKLPADVQKSLAQNFLLPMSKAEKARKKYKFYLPMAVQGLTPARIESVEKNLNGHYAQFKAEYIKKHGKEPNSLVPTIVAYADPHGGLIEIIGEPVSNSDALLRYPAACTRVVNAGVDPRERARIGAARAIIYSNGSIEWVIDSADHARISALSADRKVAAEGLYKETIQADRALGVQLGRKRTVHDRYNRVLFANPAEFLSLDTRALLNFGNVQTKQSKKWDHLLRGIFFTGNMLSAWLGYRFFFKNRAYQWEKPAQGLFGMVVLSYIAAGLIQATKNLVGGLINL